jgi:hypothetical protein
VPDPTSVSPSHDLAMGKHTPGCSTTGSPTHFARSPSPSGSRRDHGDARTMRRVFARTSTCAK